MAARVEAGDYPAYVLRETDLDPDPHRGLRATLAAAAGGAGPAVRLMVITGESSAGKTRAAVEAIRAELPAWRLVIPHSAASLKQLLDQHPRLRHTVVWLDEITPSWPNRSVLSRSTASSPRPMARWCCWARYAPTAKPPCVAPLGGTCWTDAHTVSR